MKGDFTRETFHKSKHYRMVKMQQGRVQVDADWNEQNEIQFHYEKEYLKDLIGKSGTLAKDNGFEITPVGSGFRIGSGRYYVDGILCENERSDVEYANQPDVLQHSTFVANPYLVYLDVWERHITHLDDPYIREQALGNVDTATRTKIVWQVLTLDASELGSDECKIIWENALEQKINLPTTGKLEARAKPSVESMDRCSLYETAGYTRLENQLYRIEVHDTANLEKATFKWSRENGAVVSRIIKFESVNNRLVIEKRGKDDQLDFKKDDWVEITDDLNELHGIPGTFVQLDTPEDTTITYDPLTKRPGDKPIDETNYPLSRNPKIRRWESSPLVDSSTSKDSDGYIELEYGVQIKLGEGNYRSGDYWLVPARTREGKVEWPTDSNDKPIALGPAGIYHHYAPLALLEHNNENFETKADLRSFFSSLTDLVAMHYAGGDGQQAFPGKTLPAPLRVSVTLGDRPINETPMRGVKVRITIDKQSQSSPGSLRALPDGTPSSQFVNVSINEEGIAECEWTLGDNMEQQQVKAELYDECSNKIVIPPIYFNARLLAKSQFANSGIAILTLQSPSAGPTRIPLFGPFDHKLEGLSVPPSIHLGFPFIRKEDGTGEEKDDEVIKWTEDFPIGIPFPNLVVKPVAVSTTQFYIIIISRNAQVSDATGSFASLPAFLRSTINGADSATADPEPFPLRIRWWAVPAEHTGIQESGSTGLPIRVTFNEASYAIGDRVSITLVDIFSSPKAERVNVVVTATDLISEGVELELEQRNIVGKPPEFQGLFVLEAVTQEGVVIRIGTTTKTIPKLRLGGVFQVMYELEPGSSPVSASATLLH